MIELVSFHFIDGESKGKMVGGVVKLFIPLLNYLLCYIPHPFKDIFPKKPKGNKATQSQTETSETEST